MISFMLVNSLIEKPFFRSDYFYTAYCHIVEQRVNSSENIQWLDCKTIVKMLHYPKEVSQTKVLEHLAIEMENMQYMLDRHEDSDSKRVITYVAEIYVMKMVYAKFRYKKEYRRSRPVIYQMD